MTEAKAARDRAIGLCEDPTMHKFLVNEGTANH
ncbi:hypothetical protein B0G77_0641 [Paraburkholderia sp. BL10I2N1]|nr:hypothetical protein B0G77_0641 [Paraburkholderia sp. BL10I2N1]